MPNVPFRFVVPGRGASVRAAAVAASMCLLVGFTGRPASAQVFQPINLVTDDQSANPAVLTDPDLVNAWGISFRPGSPFWVSDNGAGVTTLYNVNGATNAVSKVGLTVTIPGDGTPTGQVGTPVNSFNGFNGDLFLFASEDGTISGWRGALGTNAEVLQTGSPNNVYKGLAAATIGGHAYLYAANFRAGTIDVLKGDAGAPNLTGSFTDPTLPAGFAPFNVQVLNGKVYVTYALRDATGHDDVPGLGNGFVDVYDLQGNLLSRIATQGTLDSPWGLAIAPSTFGQFAGDLLVGNFGNGHIGAFGASTDPFFGELTDMTTGGPLTIDGLWALSVGNTGGDGSPDKLYFSAGPAGETHGLFGVLAVTPEPGAWTFLLAGALPLALLVRRRAA